MNVLQLRIHETVRGNNAGFACASCHPERSEGPYGRQHLDCRPQDCARRGQVNERPAHTCRTYLRAPCPTVSRTPASLANLSALSVASHVKSGSTRPKCPYAAVFL